MRMQELMNENLKMVKNEKNEIKVYVVKNGREKEVKIDGVEKIEKNGKVIRITSKKETKRYIDTTIYEALKEFTGIAEAEREAKQKKEAEEEAKEKEEKRKERNEKARKRYQEKKEMKKQAEQKTEKRTKKGNATLEKAA